MSPVVIVIPLTTYRGQRLYPNVRAVDRQRLGNALGRLDPSSLGRIRIALVQVLDLEA